jgi:hypothetical protein
MAQKRKYWVDKMLSGDSGVSSKRVTGTFVLLNVIVFCYMAVLSEMVLPDFMFEAICFLAGGLLGITALENVFKKDPPAVDDTTTPPSTNNEQPQ